MLFSVASLFALIASVHAHGYVDKIIVDGKTYNGPIPGETNPKSPIRRISTINPYKNPTGSGITCGEKSQLASVVAPATAGSKLDLTWVAHPNQKWPHEMGPLITYMAKVPSGQTADKFDASQGEFFKIAQEGQEGNKWFLERLMKLGTKYTVTIPKELEDGDYIMRHEIIALHLADQKGGAEFYSSCFQLRVTGGSGTAKTTASETVKFPGAYSANDKGIYVPKVFDNGFKYTFPGPAIATFANTGNSTEPETNPEEPETTEPSATVSASEPAEPTATTVPDDDCTDEGPEPSTTAAAPEPTETDDCEDPEPSASKKSNAHKNYRRAQAAARGWMSRMERRSRK